ncbi:MAG: hypothetical protein NVSMB52_03390 [Chloroflexota bacterium]
MSILVLFLLLVGVSVYWFLTQIRPEQHQLSLLRPDVADGLIESVNNKRHELGLPILELDEDLMVVAENKAIHQLMTGKSDEGWDYPAEYAGMFGHSLLMEALVTGPADKMSHRLERERDLFDGEWIRCGLGCAGGRSGQVVVTLVLCREAWEPMPEVAAHRSLVERLMLGN